MLGYWSLGQQSIGIISEYAENTAHLRGGAVADDPSELGQRERERLRDRYERRKRRISPPVEVPVIFEDIELPPLPGLEPLPPLRPDLSPIYSPPMSGDVFEIEDTTAMMHAVEAAEQAWADDQEAEETALAMLAEQEDMDREAAAAASLALLDEEEAELLANLVALGVV